MKKLWLELEQGAYVLGWIAIFRGASVPGGGCSEGLCPFAGTAAFESLALFY